MQEGTGRPTEGKPAWVSKMDHRHSKESACNAGDLGLIPGTGRSPGEGNGDPLQYCAWRIPWTEEPSGLQSMGSPKSRTQLSD